MKTENLTVLWEKCWRAFEAWQAQSKKEDLLRQRRAPLQAELNRIYMGQSPLGLLGSPRVDRRAKRLKREIEGLERRERAQREKAEPFYQASSRALEAYREAWKAQARGDTRSNRVMLAVLRAAKEPLTAREILELVQRNGWSSAAAGSVSKVLLGLVRAGAVTTVSVERRNIGGARRKIPAYLIARKGTK